MITHNQSWFDTHPFCVFEQEDIETNKKHTHTQ